MIKHNSIKQYLISCNDESSQVFKKLDKTCSALLNDNLSARYKYASATQSIEAFTQITELVTSEALTADTAEQYNDELAISMRLFLYDKGKASGLLNTFIWTKRAVIKDLASSLQTAFSGINIITAITLIRPILEQVASASITTDEISNLFELHLDLATNDKADKIINLCEIISKRGKGTRIDWETYYTKSLRTGKKKSYKKEDGAVDQTATDLMNSIDSLDKKIKGSRKAYELASEFAHPNVGAHFIYIKSASYITLVDGIRLWDRNSNRSIPEKGIEQLKDRIIEMLEITLETIDLLNSNLAQLEKVVKIVNNWSKEVIKKGITNHPLIFNLKEPCPCFSGQKFGACCGKKVKSIHREMLA